MTRPGALTLVLVATVACACARSPRAGGRATGAFGLAPVPSAAYHHYLLGRLATYEGRYDEAAVEFRVAAVAAPDELEPRVALAEALLAAGRDGDALLEAEQLVARWPREPAGWVVRGRVAAYAGDLRGAARAFERALEGPDAPEEAHVLAATTYRQLGRPADEERTYRRLVARYPEGADGHFRLGRALFLRQAWSEALAHLRRAVALDPSHIDARVALAEIYRRTGRGEDARRALREAFARSGEDPYVGKRLAVLLLEAGDRDAAASLIGTLDGEWRSAAARLDLGTFFISIRRPADALRIADEVLAREATLDAARLLRARALALLHRRAEAIRACLEVPEDAAARPDAVALAGELLGRDGRVDEALRLVGDALARGDGHARLLVVLSGLYERAKDLARARQVLDRALERAPADEELLQARAALEDRSGDPDRAIELLRPLLDLDPDNVMVLNFVGYSYANRGVRLEESDRLLRRAAELSPDDGFVLDSLGWLRFRQGRLREAASILERADRLTPEEPEILLHLGELRLHRGDRAGAVDLFERALALDPDDRIRRQLEERIRRERGGPRDADAQGAGAGPSHE